MDGPHELLQVEHQQPQAEHGHGFDPFRMVIDALSGRWMLAGAAGLVLGCAFAFLGYQYAAKRIAYQSTGLIRIVPSRPAVLYETELSEPMREYESHRLTQARFIKSQRLLDLAVEDEEFQAVGWPSGPSGVIKLRNALNVTVPRSEEMIIVGVRSGDPETARAATDAVLRAYERLAIDRAAQEHAATLKELRGLRERYRRERDEAKREVLRLAAEHGTDDLESTSIAARKRLNTIDDQINETRLRLAVAAQSEQPAPPPQGEGAEAPADDAISEMTVEQLGQYDLRLAELFDNLTQMRLRLASMSESLGPRHHMIQRTSKDLRVLEQQVETEADRVRDNLRSGQYGDSARTAGDLRATLERLEEMRKDTANDVLSLGRTQLSIEDYKQRALEAEAQLGETNARLEALEVEQDATRVGRAEIVQRAERADEPVSDKRTQLAAAGLIGGFGVGVGFVALPGMVWPRFRTVRHVAGHASAFQLLGIIPELTSSAEAADDMVQANLRQIVNRLEAEAFRDASASRVYAITSGSAGEGKTSVTTALATILARQGQRTLVIDSDTVGQAMSAQFGLTDAPGLQELIAGEISFDRLHLERVHGFYVLPVGASASVSLRSIGPRDMSAVLRAVRPSFDAVLIDTGPILGSPEAAAVAVNAERTILVVSRGQDAGVVRAAQRRLAQLGVTQIGVVFNRASRTDIERDSMSA
ncbi:MAG: hypothetical protein CMJ31_10425, partial [Phycisphaerae bacterium]|nr:hypothetical protein [Phycisphaerae bacterium]